jgi:hypothetical protein
MDRHRNPNRKIRQPQPRNTTSNQTTKRGGENQMSQPQETQQTPNITKAYPNEIELIKTGRRPRLG